MATKESKNHQFQAYEQITKGIHANPNYLNEILNAIQTGNVDEFNRITGKNVGTIKSAEGYLRLYSSYISKHATYKPRTKIPSTHKPLPVKKSTVKKSIAKYSHGIVNVAKLHPFRSSLSKELLSFQLVNNFDIKNSAHNIEILKKFASQLDLLVQDFNRNSAKSIRFIRMNVCYNSTDGTKRYFSTKKSSSTDIGIEISKLINSLTLTSLSTWNSISPSNREFIEDLHEKTFSIYAFSEISLRYYY